MSFYFNIYYIMPKRLIKGPVNLIQLQRGKQQIYVFYDVHTHADCNSNYEDLVDWIRDLPGKVDLFVEQSLFYQEIETPDMIPIFEIRQLLNEGNCPKNVRCHGVDPRRTIGVDPSEMFDLINLFSRTKDIIKKSSVSQQDYVNKLKQFSNSFTDLVHHLRMQIRYLVVDDKKIKPQELIQHRLFYKQWKKMSKKDQKQYLKINKSFKTRLDELLKMFGKIMKRLDTKPLDDYRVYWRAKMRDNFEKNREVPSFRSIKGIEDALDILISLTGEILDIYLIGRVLKPYVKTAVVYVGASHGRNIVKQLQKFGFKIKYKYKDVAYPKWQNLDKWDTSNGCIKI